MSDMIVVQDLVKNYGDFCAVNHISFTVTAGKIFGFLGPNGAGKTTTIKMLCGLLFPTEGTVKVGGFDLRTEGDRARRLISYVPDQPFLYEKLTGREFLQFTCDLYGMDRDRAAGAPGADSPAREDQRRAGAALPGCSGGFLVRRRSLETDANVSSGVSE